MARIRLPIDVSVLKVTDVNTATYDILKTDDIIHVRYTTTGAVTNIQLMNAICQTGRTIVIKDAGGNAGTNTITVTTEGAQLIDGNGSYIINSNYASISLYYFNGNWFIY